MSEYVEGSYDENSVAASDSLEPLVGKCFLFLVKRLGDHSPLKPSSFPEENRQFLPVSLQLWPMTSRWTHFVSRCVNGFG